MSNLSPPSHRTIVAVAAARKPATHSPVSVLDSLPSSSWHFPASFTIDLCSDDSSSAADQNRTRRVTEDYADAADMEEFFSGDDDEDYSMEYRAESGGFRDTSSSPEFSLHQGDDFPSESSTWREPQAVTLPSAPVLWQADDMDLGEELTDFLMNHDIIEEGETSAMKPVQSMPAAQPPEPASLTRTVSGSPTPLGEPRTALQSGIIQPISPHLTTATRPAALPCISAPVPIATPVGRGGCVTAYQSSSPATSTRSATNKALQVASKEPVLSSPTATKTHREGVPATPTLPLAAQIVVSKSSRRRRKGNKPVPPPLHPLDIVCGHNQEYSVHNGNQIFRSIILSYVDAFAATDSKRDRASMSKEIAAVVKTEHQARFVKLSPCGKAWIELDDAKVRDKIGHALRTACKRKAKTRSY